MSTIPVGSSFPDFTLDGFSSREARQGGPLVVLLWRIGCSTSRLAVPFFDRIAETYPGVQVVGICQENRSDLSDYVSQHRLKVNHLADQDLQVSKAFSLIMAPTYYVTDAGGRILYSRTAWSTQNIEDLSRLLSELTHQPFQPLIHPEDTVPAYKPG